MPRARVLSQTVTQQMVTLGTKQQPPVSPSIPTGRESGLKIRIVWVQIPPRAREVNPNNLSQK